MNLIFIFSLPRSGSTLLQRMLYAHSQVSSAPEPWILLPFIFARKFKKAESVYGSDWSAESLNEFLSLLPEGESEYYMYLQDFFIKLYRAVSDNNSVYFVDKTPRYYMIIPEIAKIFPEAKFIFLFRNPISVFASVMELWHRSRPFFRNNFVDLFKGPNLLASGYRLIEAKSLALNYEALVTEPEESMRKISNYLNLTYEAKMVNGFKGAFLQSQKGDPYVYSHSSIQKISMEKWRGVIDTKVKKLYLKKYIQNLDFEDLNLMEYDKPTLISEIEEVKTGLNLGIVDFLYLIIDQINRFCNLDYWIKCFKDHRLFYSKWH